MKIGEIDASNYTNLSHSDRLSVAGTLGRKRRQVNSQMAVNLTVEGLGATRLADAMHLATGRR